MSGKAFFIDTTLCTACRGCQIACKQWNQLPAAKTANKGTHQNPMDFDFSTYKVVRFKEHVGPDKRPVWYFFPDQCRHCMEPPCKEASEDEAPDGVLIDSYSGAVVYTNNLRKAKSKKVIEACPFNVPRVDEKTGFLAKCTMCVERVVNGLLPACVKTCPTGAMQFGEREKMAAAAKARLAQVKGKFPTAQVTGLEDLRVFYLLADAPEKYHKFAWVDLPPMAIDRKTALKRISRSLGQLAGEWSLLNKLAG